MTKSFDWGLVFPCLGLLSLGLLVLASVSPASLPSQLGFTLISVLAWLVIWRTDYRLLSSFSWWLYAFSLVLLVATLLTGATARGAARWLYLGSWQFQPSELVKPLLVIFWASRISQISAWKPKSIAALGLFWLLPAVLIFRQPDLGSALVLTAGWLGLIFATDFPGLLLFLALSLASISGPILWHFLAPYQQQRLLTFVNPASDPLRSGYQAVQTVITVGSGQLFGRGLGHGTQSSLRFLPEKHTDFIFAALAEELGFIGVSLVIVLFGWLLWRILVTAKTAPDTLGSLICWGVFGLLFFQVFINIGMNLGLMPITGITLPFLSAGGSSLLATAVSLGLVANVASRRRSHMLQFSP